MPLLFVYTLLTLLLWPLVILGFVWRFGLRRTLAGLPERFGFGGPPAPPGRPLIWVHAASVGEVRAAEALLARLPSQFPGCARLLTTTSVTGLDLARSLGLAEVSALAPLDIPWSVVRRFARWRPDVLVLIETEIWPHWLRVAARRRVPVVVLNARISDRTFRSYQALKAMWKPLLRTLAGVGAQSERHASRWRGLGADPDRVSVTGNLKHDVPFPDKAGRAALAAKYGFSTEEEIFVCGSTRPGEEEILLEAFQTLAKDAPALKLILAPRHTERAAEVERLLSRRELEFQRRSDLVKTPGPVRAPVLILDTLGELAEVYGLARWAFLGGSLVPQGGQNPLEPARWGVPMVFGPHMENFQEIADALLAVGGAAQVADAGDIVRRLRAWRQNPAAAKSAGAAAETAARSEAGAVARSLELLGNIL